MTMFLFDMTCDREHFEALKFDPSKPPMPETDDEKFEVSIYDLADAVEYLEWKIENDPS